VLLLRETLYYFGHNYTMCKLQIRSCYSTVTGKKNFCYWNEAKSGRQNVCFDDVVIDVLRHTPSGIPLVPVLDVRTPYMHRGFQKNVIAVFVHYQTVLVTVVVINNYKEIIA
jgi:hypothetical protein